MRTLQRSLELLEELLQEPEQDEYGIARPTNYAYQQARKIIEETKLPFHSLTSFDGGIVLYHDTDRGEIHVHIPPGGEEVGYIFWMRGDLGGKDYADGICEGISVSAIQEALLKVEQEGTT